MLGRELKLKPLRKEVKQDVRELQSVLEGAPAYWKRISGMAVGTDAAVKAFKALPEGKSYRDKFVLGVFASDKMVGCIDLIRGFPNPETAMLGLLLIREGVQRRGIGRATYQLPEEVIRTWAETKKVRIGVIATNDVVMPFWKGCGFQETGLRRPFQDGSVVSESVVLEKTLI